MSIEERTDQFRESFQRLKDEIGKIIVGSQEIVEGSLICLFAGGHALLEGVPGLGKTLLVRTLSQALDLKFSRVQFTPDLMPADIVGTNVIDMASDGSRAFRFERGPIFANVVLADEINRATPKTQSALLEAMQEHRVTAGGTTYTLDQPFVVLATQNPLEMEGTYPLPEAQLDRFLLKLMVDYPSRDELTEVLERTTGKIEPHAEKIMDGQTVRDMRALCREVPIASHVRDFGVRCILASHPGGEFAADLTNRFVKYGSSPRGAQALILCGKIRALLDGRYSVSFDDIRASLKPVLRHRIILNFEGEAEGMTSDRVIDNILEQVQPAPKAAAV
ncbi:MAG: AAA domain-containing protein [bacterium]|nr:AAA domain-containing protein [bacterium]